ncbi:MAG: hypothetical protein JWP04_1163 [Belnapia sp.]|nr:hypothetical protein [Belnapia sp.]
MPPFRLAAIAFAAFAAIAPLTAQAQAPSRVEVVPLGTRTLTGQEFLRGQAGAGRESLIAGELRLPAGLRPGQKVPAMVLVHGSGGLGGSADQWARELNGAGVAAFILDSFAGRGIVSTVQDQTQLHSLAMLVDSYRALDWLAEHPRIRADRIGIIGFSKGAVAAVYSAMTRFQAAYGNPAHRFAAHIGLYTPCNVAYRGDTALSPVPIRLFHGIADDYVAIGPCRDYVARLVQAGADATLVEYPEAHHSFDNPFGPPLLNIPAAQTTRACRLAEGPDGATLNAETGAPFAVAADACVGRGAHTGHNAAAATAVRAAVREFVTAKLVN